MDSVFRAAAVYLILLVILRIAGKRTLAQITVFDFILVLIISEATQQALLGDDFSITAAASRHRDAGAARHRAVGFETALAARGSKSSMTSPSSSSTTASCCWIA